PYALPIWPHAFQVGDKPRGLVDVPDVDADADDLRLLGEDRFQDVDGPLADVEFEELRMLAEFAEVGVEVAQPERGVREFGVESRENEVGHHPPARGRESLSRFSPFGRCCAIAAAGRKRETRPPARAGGRVLTFLWRTSRVRLRRRRAAADGAVRAMGRRLLHQLRFAIAATDVAIGFEEAVEVAVFEVVVV